MRVFADINKIINIGHAGENLATQVVFDISKWIEAYGHGSTTLVVEQGGMAYPQEVSILDNEVVWTITNSNTAFIGMGRCELFYSVDEVIVKSAIYDIMVANTLVPDSDAPAAYQGWVDSIINSVNYIEENVPEIANIISTTEAARDRAETARDGAEAARDGAEFAQEQAEAAQEQAEGAQELAEIAKADTILLKGETLTIKGQAETARDRAETAQTASETAEGKAKDAQDRAESAQTAAEFAQGKAEGSQDSAESAQTAAEFAQGQAEAAEGRAGLARSAAEQAQGRAETARDRAESAETSVQGMYEELDIAISSIPARAEFDEHKVDNAPHQYGGRFEWQYNSDTDSLDLVVIE